MQFGILGPLEVRSSGVPVAIGGPKRVSVLAALLLRSNQVVLADRLVDLVWRDDPPRTAQNVLQANIAALRRALDQAEPHGGARIETHGRGYRLRVEPDELDADAFERLIALARAGAPDAAVLVRRALGLWRGEVLSDVDLASDLLPEVTRLEELRLEALEFRLRLDLDAGNHAACAAELERMRAEHPYRESLLALQMLSLYRAGRQADALTAYQDGRRLLIDDLGLEPGPDVRALERAILEQDPSLLATHGSQAEASPELLGGRRHNLPSDTTSFVGRQSEVEAVVALLDGARLVTVVGPGGAGKTRVVVEAARRLLDSVPGGVWWIDLTSVGSGEAIVDAAASALGVVEQPGRALFDSLAGRLRDERTVLVFDNCEPVIWECARLCEGLLQAAAGLRILTASREPLRIGAETVWPLPPMAEAVDLFVERGRAVRPDAPIDRDSAVVTELVARLDRLPLAVEMAAARLRSMAPAEILDRLDDRFRLLTGSRTAPARHRTLQATIDWSYDALEPAEQALLRHLSAFAGPADLEAVGAVCGGPACGDDPADSLAVLVDRSLVVVLHGADRTRYTLLDSVREYGRVKLREVDEEADVFDRHLAWCRAQAASAYAERTGREGEVAARLSDLLDELRVALGRSAADADAFVPMAADLGWFWVSSGRFSEGLRLVRAALDLAPADGKATARLLTALGAMASFMGDEPTALDAMARAVESWSRLNDPREHCAVLDALGWARFWPGDNDGALAAFQQGAALAQSIDDAGLLRRHWAGECQVLVALGDVARARPLAENLVRVSPTEDLRTAHFGHHFLADCALMEADPAGAAAEYANALRLAFAMGDPVETAVELQGVAMAQHGCGRAREAMLLGGAAEAALEAIEVEVTVPFWLALIARWLPHTPDDPVWQEGRGLDPAAAVDLALSLPVESGELAHGAQT